MPNRVNQEITAKGQFIVCPIVTEIPPFRLNC